MSGYGNHGNSVGSPKQCPQGVQKLREGGGVRGGRGICSAASLKPEGRAEGMEGDPENVPLVRKQKKDGKVTTSYWPQLPTTKGREYL